MHALAGLLYRMPDYRAALSLDPTDQSAHYRLARLYQRSGQNASARKEFEIYRQLQKRNDTPSR